MARQRRTRGAIVRISLGDGWHSYAQILDEPEFAFFDSRSREDLLISEIVKRPVLFRVAVMNYAVTAGRWLKVGAAEVAPQLSQPQPQFIQDPLAPSRFEIYLGGHIRPATRDECAGLERAAVWEPEHVEDRIRDHYAGKANKWVKSLSLNRN
jgi:hypothetical protein